MDSYEVYIRTRQLVSLSFLFFTVFPKPIFISIFKDLVLLLVLTCFCSVVHISSRVFLVEWYSSDFLIVYLLIILFYSVHTSQNRGPLSLSCILRRQMSFHSLFQLPSNITNPQVVVLNRISLSCQFFFVRCQHSSLLFGLF